MRMVFVIALTVAIEALTLGHSEAGGAIRCVRVPGIAEAPPNCETFDDMYAAQAASLPGDEVRFYGRVEITTTLTLVAKKLVGFSDAVLDARANDADDAVAMRIVQAGVLVNFTLKTSGTGTGIQLKNPERVVTLDGVSIQGPPGGNGIGIDVLPGAGRLTVYGNTQPSVISGHRVGVRAIDPQGRPSVNGATARERRVTIRDVEVGIEDGVAVPAQWFKTEISCDRKKASTGNTSIGYHGLGSSRSDLNGLLIHNCDVGLKLECVGNEFNKCGGHREFDNLRVGHRLDGQVPVRVVLPGVGGVVDNYEADPGCGDQWSRSTWFNDGPLQSKFLVRCPK
jgi:hypothetical protein